MKAPRGMSGRQQGVQELALTKEAADVLAAVHENPGCNLSQARQRTGLGRHVFANALDALVEAGLVYRVATGGGVLLLPDRPGIEGCLDQIKALLDPRVQRLHDFLSGHEICPHRDIIDHAAQAWDWDAEATRWRLRLLEKADLAQAVVDLHDRRCITYRGLPAHPIVRDVLGEAGLDS